MYYGHGYVSVRVCCQYWHNLKVQCGVGCKKVSELKNAIFEKRNIPVADQVLLCSGGEELKSDVIVGNYSGAGTDTNPIFLFQKGLFDPDNDYEIQQLNAPIKTSMDLSIQADVEGCANMMPSIQAIAVKATLAQRFSDYALKGKEECISLVRDQHLQQQAWAAVIANLDDIKDALQKSFYYLNDHFERFLENVPNFQEILKLALDDIALLAKVPVLPKLIGDSVSTEDSMEKKHTLLTWFCTEPQYYLESVTEKCQSGIDTLDETCLVALKEEFMNVLKDANRPDIKEVKGIGERLANLNTLIEDFDKLCNDQIELMKRFFNADRMGYARDPNVLPDICNTYQTHLGFMLQHHQRLIHILEKCTRAKQELSLNINKRIQYISCIESSISKMQTKIHNFVKYMKSVTNQIDCLQQVHMAPQRYLKMCAEVCRRKEFSARYMKWATELSSQCLKLYENESSHRKQMCKETRNMVDGLFPGMHDMPPPFAVECPNLFDENLPDITREDLEWLKTCVPELSHLCEVIPPEAMPSVSHAESDSAFSSNIPSSLKIVGLSYKVVAPSADFNSLPSEYTSLPNEAFSLTSSPFEDSFLPNGSSENKIKRTRLSQVSVSVAIMEEKRSLSVDSDGEEFETLDNYSTSPLEITTHSLQEARLASIPHPTSSNTVDYSNPIDQCLRVSKASSDGDAISPVQDRLKSSDSLLASTDFQGTEYYIDDSMPSSYTESNATSPLMRGNRLVKSHHVVLAELQRQLEEKNEALAGNSSSLENSHSNILKVHAKISTLQKFIGELQKNLQHDLSNLKASVKDDLFEGMSQASQIVENINIYLGKLHQQMLIEKEEAVLSSLEEVKHEKDHLYSELQDKEESLKRNMLEHELEFDSFKNQMKDKLEEKESKINALKQALADSHRQIADFDHEKSQIQEDYNAKLSEMQEKQNNMNQEIIRLQESKDIKNDSELEAKLKVAINEKIQCMKDLEKMQQNLENFAIEREKCEISALKELEEKLAKEHEMQMEFMRFRYKTALEDLSVTSDIEALQPELRGTLEHIKKGIIEHCETEAVQHQFDFVEERTKVMEEIKAEIFKRQQERDKMIATLQSEHEEALEKWKSRITAENQVSFNEAINRLAKEKDAVVGDLRSRICILEKSLYHIKINLNQYAVSEDSAAVSKSTSPSEAFPSCSSKIGISANESKFVSKLMKELNHFFEPIAVMSQDAQSNLSESLKKTSIQLPCFECKNKISIFTCNEGDLVLLCYEERHENFAVFHLGSFVHFLHSDSLQALNLKLPAEANQRWALGIVVKKEFCPENRFKVSCGTKFYRVKVKPWDRNAALHQMQRSIYMTSTICSSKPSSSQSASKDGDGGKGGSGSMSVSSI
ncbi:RB1-inducible coiled-coil protein 1 [Caerostris extrusa]|uniref:RB1-inducible coiled-coil protein 1 n=1 Tax=Caerostris extrusa TaxID=172846 RepID=A0AAV4MM92_CAEEX|nr:RB1-inducible coiled-coil protein 1 [Caerostris extrusa]